MKRDWKTWLSKISKDFFKWFSNDFSDVHLKLSLEGHHAEPELCRGFCLFGNVALAAAMARQQGA